MRKVGVGVLVLLAGCTGSVNENRGAVAPAATESTTTAPELTTTTTEAVLEPATTQPPREFPGIVESSTTVYSPPVTRRSPQTTTPRSSSSDLASIRACESGGDYTTDTGNGYYGAYQFTLSTWASVGGSGNPADASPSEQDSRAQMLIDSGYRSAWPNC